ncbi:MAG: GNAT family N-acetyltransferase [Clostridia bacterium]|nr:GNAT family N-acetyltransferase [Clostridia bacterium]
MIVYQKLSKDNYKDVLNIKHQLFPESNSDDDYEEYFNDVTKSNYYLILKDDCECATIGWYEYNSKNAFVGWFGVLPEFQQNGIGHEILNYIIAEVKKMKYDYLRVYTDKVVNYVSTKLYDKLFDLREDYTYPDKIGSTNNFVIYTKFLSDKKEKWNNTPLNEDYNYDI